MCPVGENFSEYASEVYDSLVRGVPGLRIECDTDNETLGKYVAQYLFIKKKTNLCC